MAKVLGACVASDYILRPSASSSFGVSLKPDASLASSYTLTLPVAAPASSGVALQSTSSGASAAYGWGANFGSSAFRVSQTTKQLAIDVSSVADNTTRTLAMPDRNISLNALSQTGWESWTGEVATGVFYSISGTTFTLKCTGTGYVRGSAVSWVGDQNATLTANKTNTVYVDASGTIGISTTGYVSNSIQLFQVLYDGTVYLVKPENHPFAFNNSASRFFHNNLGTIIRGTGANLTAVVGQPQVAVVGSDVYEDHGVEFDVTAASPATFEFWFFQTTTNTWRRYLTPFTNWVPYRYTAGQTDPALVNNNQYALFRVYVTGDISTTGVITTRLIALVDTASYGTIAASDTAISSGTVVAPSGELAGMELCQLGYVLVQRNGTTYTIAKVTVQKNTFNARYIGGSTGSSHLILSDLNGGQYKDGSHTYLTQLNATTSDPSATDDLTTYKNGTIWINTSALTGWVCVDNTLNAAVWLPLTNNRVRVHTLSASATLTTAHEGMIRVDATAGAVTLTLPLSSSTLAGATYTFVKVDAGTNAMIIQRNGTDTIDYAATAPTTTTQGGRLSVVCDGSGNWVVL